jgi:hypothetical protein
VSLDRLKKKDALTHISSLSPLFFFGSLSLSGLFCLLYWTFQKKKIKKTHTHNAQTQHIIRSAVLTGRPFLVQCESSVGAFTLEIHPAWAPWGVERFLKLLGDTWFDDSPFFRAIPRFLVQFGASLSQAVQQR